MNSRIERVDVDAPAVAATAGLPLVVGLAALVQGYPLPRQPTAVAGALAGGAVRAAAGRLAWAGYRRGLRVAPAAVPLGVAGALAWSLLAPGVAAARVGATAVLAGDPVLARFVGTAPLFGVAVGCLVPLEVAARDEGTGQLPRWLSTGPGRRRALGRALGAGVAVAASALAPGVLLGRPLASPGLLAFAVCGTVAGGTAVGYLWLGHRLLAPVVGLAVVALAAGLAVTAGGSPRGFPVAWPVWVLPALALGGVEAAARRVRSLLGGG